MTLEEFKETEWYKERPDIIKQVIEKIPPIQLYQFKNSGHQCVIYCYDEPESGKVEDITVKVDKTGAGSLFPEVNKYRVFGVKPDDLEPWRGTGQPDKF